MNRQYNTDAAYIAEYERRNPGWQEAELQLARQLLYEVETGRWAHENKEEVESRPLPPLVLTSTICPDCRSAIVTCAEGYKSAHNCAHCGGCSGLLEEGAPHTCPKTGETTNYFRTRFLEDRGMIPPGYLDIGEEGGDR